MFFLSFSIADLLSPPGEEDLSRLGRSGLLSPPNMDRLGLLGLTVRTPWPTERGGGGDLGSRSSCYPWTPLTESILLG